MYVAKIREVRRKKLLKNRIQEIGLTEESYKHRQHALINTKHRAKKKNIEFNLRVVDVKWPSVCPILEIPIIYQKDAPVDNRPSIDRIDPSKGYTKSNCRVVSHRGNLLKSNATIEEIELVLKDLTRLQK